MPRSNKQSTNKSSLIKAAGIKSVLLIDDNKGLVTSFGNGNEAVREYNIAKDSSEGEKEVWNLTKCSDNDNMIIQFKEIVTKNNNTRTFKNKETVKKSVQQVKKKGNRIKSSDKSNKTDKNKQYSNNNPIKEEIIVKDYRYINISNNRVKKPLTVFNPVYDEKSRKYDQAHLRDFLEKYYFGQNYNDNIHVQIAYCITDIEKLITPYINDIIESINNLIDHKARYDLVATLDPDVSYETFMDESIKQDARESFKKLRSNKRLGYFGLYYKYNSEENNESNDLFKSLIEINKKPEGELEKNAKYILYGEHIYYILLALSYVRHALVHSGQRNLYNFNTQNPHVNETVPELINILWNIKNNKINRSFINNSQKNLCIIFDLLSREDKNNVLEKYYAFAIEKDYKNLGFSVKKLREKIIEIYDTYSGSNKKIASIDSSWRNKINSIIDFIIYYSYSLDTEATKNFVNSLRMSTDEKSKDSVYESIVDGIYNNRYNVLSKQYLWPKIDSLLSYLNKEKFSKLMLTDDLKEELSNIIKNTNIYSLSPFGCLIYAMTLFMDGKEINELLTGLIHKFSDIEGFIDVLKKEHIDVDLSDEFSMFYKSSDMVREMRYINNIARMYKGSAVGSGTMIEDALSILGCDEEKIQGIKDRLLPKVEHVGEYSDNCFRCFVCKKEYKIDKAWTDKLFCSDNCKKKYNDDSIVKKNKKNRNFIINNVNNSQRFIYLARYTRISDIHKIIESRSIVSMVVNDIPDSQIERYYNSYYLYDNNKKNVRQMRNALIEELVGFSYDKIDMLNSDNLAVDIERNKSLVRLYLTVLYIAVKNLVHINSRYFMAFYCFDRDRKLIKAPWQDIICEKPKQQINENDKMYNAFVRYYIDPPEGDIPLIAFTDKYLKNQNNKNNPDDDFNKNHTISDDFKEFSTLKRNKKYRDSLKNSVAVLDCENNKKSLAVHIRAFRNEIEHLSHIRGLGSNIYDQEDGLKFKDINFSSWFDLYQWCIQVKVLTSIKNKRSLELLTDLYQYAGPEYKDNKKYSKKMLRCLCLPFAYNKPRYLNLTNEALFDMNIDYVRKSR